MIRLSVNQQCQDCPSFEPTIKTYRLAAEPKKADHTITCIYADHCKAIREKVIEIKQSGVVEKVYRDHVNGWCVTVKCGRNKHTYIMLKDRPKVNPGDMVKIGEIL